LESGAGFRGSISPNENLFTGRNNFCRGDRRLRHRASRLAAPKRSEGGNNRHSTSNIQCLERTVLLHLFSGFVG